PVLLVLARAKHDVPVLPGKLLLGDADADLLRAERHVVVIKRQHSAIPLVPGWAPCACPARPSSAASRVAPARETPCRIAGGAAPPRNRDQWHGHGMRKSRPRRRAHWRIFLSANRCPLRRNMRQPRAAIDAARGISPNCAGSIQGAEQPA